MGTSLAPVFDELKNEMMGTEVHLSSPSVGVEELANSKHFIAINLTGQTQNLGNLGRTVELSPYEILTG